MNAIRTPRALGAALVLCVVAYSTSLPNGFTWDDEYVLLRNPAVHDLANAPRFFTDASTSASYGGLTVYRPLRTLAFAAEHALWGDDPRGYHAVNLLLHLANVLLVFLLARRLLADARWAIVVATLFAVHPIGTEAVASVVGMGDLASAALLLGAFLLHLDVDADRARSRRRAAGVTALFLASACFKETSIVLPALAAWGWLCGIWQGRARPAWRAGYLAILFLAAAGFFALRSAVIGGMNAGQYDGITFARTMSMQAEVLARYLRLIAWPAGLSARHSIPVPLSPFEPGIVVAAVVLVAVASLAAWARRRAPLVTFGLGWFFVALLPVMNFIPLPGAIMGERFLYVPALGIYLALAGGIRRWLWPRLRPELAPIGAGFGWALAIALAATTLVRNRDWRDNLTLFEAAVKVAPDSNAVRLNLIREYQLLGDPARARRHLEAAAATTRQNLERYLTLAAQAEEAGDAGESAAWYRRALSMDPRDPRALAGLARVGAAR